MSFQTEYLTPITSHLHSPNQGIITHPRAITLATTSLVSLKQDEGEEDLFLVLVNAGNCAAQPTE
jgi:hypothetical protein